MEGTPDREPLEHSVLNMAQDDGLAQESGEPMFGSDRGRTSTEIPDAMRTVDLGLGAAVPFPDVPFGVGDQCGLWRRPLRTFLSS